MFRSRCKYPTICSEIFLQRLFSTFANGWPGLGLLLQRVLTATMLIRFGIAQVIAASGSFATARQIIGACAGMFLLVGLWTPVVGALIAVVEL